MTSTIATAHHVHPPRVAPSGGAVDLIDSSAVCIARSSQGTGPDGRPYEYMNVDPSETCYLQVSLSPLRVSLPRHKRYSQRQWTTNDVTIAIGAWACSRCGHSTTAGRSARTA